ACHNKVTLNGEGGITAIHDITSCRTGSIQTFKLYQVRNLAGFVIGIMSRGNVAFNIEKLNRETKMKHG
ncbi:MAG: hypothetical protein ACT6FF_00620, partial [Methanosarcinaceae archaeon]